MIELQQRWPGSQREEQGQRRDQKAHHRNRQRVGQRRDQRKLLEQEQQQGQRPDGHRPLRRPPVGKRRAPAAPLADPCRANEEEHADGGEREPETWRKNGPGIEQQDQQQRQQEAAAGAEVAPRPQRQRDDAQHVERALCRHGETGEQGVAESGQPAGGDRRFRRRQQQHQALATPPQPADQRGKKRGDHGHVKT